MASGGRKLLASQPMTVMPTVRTRKNVPMNSTRYFFIGTEFKRLVDSIQSSFMVLRRQPFQDFDAEQSILKRLAAEQLHRLVIFTDPLHELDTEAGRLPEIAGAEFVARRFDDQNIIRGGFFKSGGHVTLSK